MSIVITPGIPLVAAQGAAADIVLQPGSVISAKVLQVLGNDQVKVSIAGQSLDVLSQVPLQAGQTLQLQVSQTADGIGLAVVSQQGGASASQGVANSGSAGVTGDTVTLAPGAVANVAVPATPANIVANQLTALETSAASAAAQTAATQQISLATLFANLGVAAGLTGLPPEVQQAVVQVLAQQTSLNQGLTGNDIKQAFQTSGLFLEASLASGSVPSSSAPDLKAALIVLRQVLTTSLGSASATPGASATQITSATLPQGAASSTAAQSATPTEVVVQQGTTPTAAEAAQPGTTPGAVAIGEVAQPSVQV
jgi:hypothetical protein